MRVRLDAYYSPSTVCEPLLRHVPALRDMHIIEPCAGSGALLAPFKNVRPFDIDPSYGFPVEDARVANYAAPVDAFITNPPFGSAYDILRNVRRQAPLVALLLRLSFLEPTYERGRYLQEHGPSMLIVLPRISFTGDGRTDSVTCAWMVWGDVPRGVHVEARP